MNESLKQILNYDPLTGLFIWNDGSHPKRAVGKPAGGLDVRGYVVIRYKRKAYLAHRLAWFLSYGEWPPEDIDHINGNRADNRISNLRPVTRRVNMENQRAYRPSSSTQLLGVYKKGAYFGSKIASKGTQYYLGQYSTAEEAHEAYISAKRKLHEGSLL